MRSPIGSIALAAAMICAATSAQAFDEIEVSRLGRPMAQAPRRRQSMGYEQAAAPGASAADAGVSGIYEANLKDQAAGGQGTDPTYTCIPDGMPRAMNVIFPMEIVITPKITYIMIEYLSMLRRIYTDGRDWPEDVEPSLHGLFDRQMGRCGRRRPL